MSRKSQHRTSGLQAILVFLILLFGKVTNGQTYCTPGAPGSAWTIAIDNVTIGDGGGINKTDGLGAGGARDYTGDPDGTVSKGSNYSSSVTVQTTASSGQILYVGVDWNDDGDWLDASEMVVSQYFGPASATPTHSFTLSVPSGASTATVRMRVYMKNAVDGDFCTGPGQQGEYEDYELVVSPAGSAPTVTTAAADDLTCNSATLNGELTDAGGSDVTKGFIYGTSESDVNSSTSSSLDGSSIKVTHGTVDQTLTTFDAAISSLTPGQTYWVKAFGSNSTGEYSPTAISFTASAASMATVAATGTASSITCSSADVGGEVTADGCPSITERGLCYATTTGPEITDTKVVEAGTTGSWTGSLTGLAGSTTYYVRAYATNSAGTQYGTESSFTTSTPCVPTITTTTAGSAETCVSAETGGETLANGGFDITAKGVVWNTAGSPTISSNLGSTNDGTLTPDFTSTMSGLSGSTAYKVRAYATNAQGTGYGPEITITTTAPCTEPAVSAAGAATSITCGTADVIGEVTSDGGSAITERGLVYGLTSNPTTSDSKLVEAGTTGSWTGNLTGLTGSQTYYVRAFATNGVGTSYGTQISFATSAPCVPTVTITDAATAITSSTATSGGTVTSDNGYALTAKGVVWHTSSGPTLANNSTDDGTTVAAFTSAITGLSPGTTYYVRAYATNSHGTTYGPEISFISSAAVPPSIDATINPYTVTCSTADPRGDVTSDNGFAISERGIVYSTSSGPTTSDSKNIVAGTTGSFSGSLSGLSTSTTYYARAYAINAGGTSYGAEVSFTTHSGCGATPTISTDAATGVHCESMTANGNLSGSTGTLVEFGFIWGTSLADVTSASVTNLDGMAKILHPLGTTNHEPYGLELDGLSASTTYYYKAFGTNENGSAYGTVTTQATTAACPVYYSCATVNQWDTDPSCSSPSTYGAGVLNTAIGYMRHDWDNKGYDEVANLNNLVATYTANFPYRLVVQSGGFVVHGAASFPTGAQVIVESGGIYAIATGLAVDDGAALKVTKLRNDGTVLVKGAMNNSGTVSGTGLFCLTGAYINDLTDGASLNGISAQFLDSPTDYQTDGTYDDGTGGTPCIQASTLPVELMAFDATLKDNYVEITWTTGSEINSYYFEVLTSSNGVNWEVMTTVNGAGNTSRVSHYAVKDVNISHHDVKYYKLRQVDFDGQFTHSVVRVVNITNTAGIDYAYDDGENIHLYYRGISGPVEVKLYDINSKVIPLGGVYIGGTDRIHLIAKKQKVTPSGVYFIQLSSGSKSFSSKLFVK